MQVDSQRFLAMAEKAKSIAFFDIEANGLNGDYNSVLVVSVKPYGQKPISLHVNQIGNDQKLVREAKELLETFDCWVSYYGKGFDIPMLNTRLLKWEQWPIAKRHHVDMYYVLRYNVKTSRHSQAHLLTWLGTKEQKMTVSADVWNMMAANPRKYMPTMIKRCESDTIGLEALYDKSKHLISEITR
jgi:uncharacterized protein YprB with RNaseH-like and TPR domain